MTETTAGTKLTRPSFDEAYQDLCGFDDMAISTHLGYDIEELIELLNDGLLTNRQWGQLVEAFEFVSIRRRPNTPDDLAGQLIREMKRGELGDILNAYLEASGLLVPGDDPDPESAEGKDSSPSAQPSSPRRKPTAKSAAASAGSD